MSDSFISVSIGIHRVLEGPLAIDPCAMAVTPYPGSPIDVRLLLSLH